MRWCRLLASSEKFSFRISKGIKLLFINMNMFIWIDMNIVYMNRYEYCLYEYACHAGTLILLYMFVTVL